MTRIIKTISNRVATQKGMTGVKITKEARREIQKRVELTVVLLIMDALAVAGELHAKAKTLKLSALAMRLTVLMHRKAVDPSSLARGILKTISAQGLS